MGRLSLKPANKGEKRSFPINLNRQTVYSLTVALIKQDSLIFIGCIDFASCGSEINVRVHV
jgi:hypothetical protein